MKAELKIWAGLGLATALAGAGLTGCSGENAAADQAAESAQTALGSGSDAGEAGEGVEGQDGEGGEGGVSIAEAANDPVAYKTALAVVEAHVIAAHDAFLAGKTDAAAEMFAHPVSEVLIDMDPVFAERGVADFKPLLTDASAAVLAGESAQQIGQRYASIIAALRGAAAKAPSNGASEVAVASGVAADMIDRAIAMYARAGEGDSYEPYLDGYGFYKAGETAFRASEEAIKADNGALYTRITEALALLGQAYPKAERPASLDVNQGALMAASSKMLLAAS